MMSDSPNIDPTALGSLAQAFYSVSDRDLARAVSLCKTDPALLIGEALVKIDAITWVDRRKLLQKQEAIRAGHASFSDTARMASYAAKKAERVGDQIRDLWDTLGSRDQ